MRFLSLFAGIGGLDLGLERAGMTCVGQVEIDPFCRKVLAKHWPNVWRHDDIRTLRADMLPERPDLICGGFPCQDISNAGKRAGIDGERSGLWAEYHRIVCEVRPRYVVVENVAALLGRGLDRVLGDLASCGYDAEWDCVSACQLGAPQMRFRLFVVAHRQGPHGIADRAIEPESRAIGGGTWWASEPGVVRVAHGVPARVDRLRSLGNAVVPQVAEVIGRAVMRSAASLPQK